MESHSTNEILVLKMLLQTIPMDLLICFLWLCLRLCSIWSARQASHFLPPPQISEPSNALSTNYLVSFLPIRNISLPYIAMGYPSLNMT